MEIIPVIHPVEPQLMKEIAEFHKTIFPDYFLTHLGLRFLYWYYENFTEPPGYCYIAKENEQIIGLIVGASDNAYVANRFYRNHFVLIATTVAWKSITDKFIRKSVLDRVGRIRDVLKALVIKNQRPRSSKEPSDAYSSQDKKKSRIVGLGVHPDYRRRGTAKELVDVFLNRLIEDNVQEVGLSILTDNSKARRFFVDIGWELETEGSSSCTYIKRLG